jgi:hypothetical protein
MAYKDIQINLMALVYMKFRRYISYNRRHRLWKISSNLKTKITFLPKSVYCQKCEQV